MVLVVLDDAVAEHVFIRHVLQTKQGSRFVPADIAEVIRTTATQRHQFGVGIFLDVHFVESVVAIVLYAKNNAAGKLVVLHHFNIT
jgi:hypothetical protein